MRVTWDSFATPAQVGEIHRLGGYEYLSIERTDNLVRDTTGKYPQELTQQEATDLIKKWRFEFPRPPFGFLREEWDDR